MVSSYELIHGNPINFASCVLRLSNLFWRPCDLDCWSEAWGTVHCTFEKTSKSGTRSSVGHLSSMSCHFSCRDSLSSGIGWDFLFCFPLSHPIFLLWMMKTCSQSTLDGSEHPGYMIFFNSEKAKKKKWCQHSISKEHSGMHHVRHSVSGIIWLNASMYKTTTTAVLEDRAHWNNWPIWSNKVWAGLCRARQKRQSGRQKCFLRKFQHDLYVPLNLQGTACDVLKRGSPGQI